MQFDGAPNFTNILLVLNFKTKNIYLQFKLY